MVSDVAKKESDRGERGDERDRAAGETLHAAINVHGRGRRLEFAFIHVTVIDGLIIDGHDGDLAIDGQRLRGWSGREVRLDGAEPLPGLRVASHVGAASQQVPDVLDVLDRLRRAVVVDDAIPGDAIEPGALRPLVRVETPYLRVRLEKDIARKVFGGLLVMHAVIDEIADPPHVCVIEPSERFRIAVLARADEFPSVMAMSFPEESLSPSSVLSNGTATRK